MEEQSFGRSTVAGGNARPARFGFADAANEAAKAIIDTARSFVDSVRVSRFFDVLPDAVSQDLESL
jgi:hypothetical protein